MFKTLYRCARTAARHDNGSSCTVTTRLPETPRCGRCHSALPARERRCAISCGCLLEFGRHESSGTNGGRKHCKRLGASPAAMASGPEGTEKEFRYITCCWLRFAGRLQEPARPATPHQAELDAYCRYMTAERGLAKAT